MDAPSADLQTILNSIVPGQPGPVLAWQFSALFGQQQSCKLVEQSIREPAASSKNGDERALASGVKDTIRRLAESFQTPLEPVIYTWSSEKSIKPSTMSSYVAKLNKTFKSLFRDCCLRMNAERKGDTVRLHWVPTGASQDTVSAPSGKPKTEPRTLPSISPYRDYPYFKLGGTTQEYYFISTASEAVLPEAARVSRQKVLQEQGLELVAKWMKAFVHYPSRIIAERTLGFDGVFVSSGEDPTTALCEAIERVETFTQVTTAREGQGRSERVAFEASELTAPFASTPLNIVMDSGMAKLRGIETLTGKHFLNHPPCCENAGRLLRHVKNTRLFGSVPMRLGPHVHLLLSRDVFRRVRHRYYCDAIDTSLEQQAYRITSPARPWCPLLAKSKQQRSEFESRFDSLLDFGAVACIHTVDEPRASAVAHLAVRRIETRLPGNMVTRWQCHYSRRRELLYPLIECLRDLLNLNHTSSQQDPRVRIREWVQDCCRAWPQADRENCIHYLAVLLGGDTDGPYRDIVDLLTRLFHEIATKQARLVIVVENVHWADELTRELVTRLSDLATRIEQDISARLTERANAQEELPIRLYLFQPCGAEKQNIDLPGAHEEMPEFLEIDDTSDAATQYLVPHLEAPHTALLLRIAAWIGWDQPLSWLKFLWTRVTASHQGENPEKPTTLECRDAFPLALEELIRAGILRSGGRLRPLIPGQDADGIVFFTSLSMFDALVPEADSDLAQQLGRAFLDMVHEQLELADHNTARLRRKVIICDLLERIGAERWESSLPREQVARLWRLLARRANAAGGINETLQRSHAALQLVLSAADDRFPPLLAGSILTDYLNWITEFRPETSSIGPALDHAKTWMQRKAPDEHSSWEEMEQWLDLGRAVWQWHLRWESLEECRVFAELLRSRLVAYQSGPNPCPSIWEIESLHLLAVTYLMQADFDKCLTAASSARAQCKQLKGFKGNPLLFAGKHDAAGCCKLLRAGVFQLTENDAEKEAWEELEAFLDSKDEVSNLSARFHVRLFDLLSGQHDNENPFFSELPAPNPKNRNATKWHIQTQLAVAAQGIMRTIMAEASGDVTPGTRASEMQKAQTQLEEGLEASRPFGSEFRPLWKAFEAFACHLSGQPASEHDCLERISAAYHAAKTRGERLIQPEIAYLAATLAAHQHDLVTAHKWIKTGESVAADHQLTVYSARFTNLRARLPQTR